MTFNEWWAGQNLPESSKAVALAAWYAHQLYGERIVQPVDFQLHRHGTTTAHPLDVVPHEAHGSQLDAIGEQLGVIREHDTHGVETDQSYRERLRQKYRDMLSKDECRLGGDHQWDSFVMLGGQSEVHCVKCGVTP